MSRTAPVLQTQNLNDFSSSWECKGRKKRSAEDKKESAKGEKRKGHVRHYLLKSTTRNNFSSLRECKGRKKGSAEGRKTGARTNKNLCAEGTERKDYKK